MTKEWRVVSSRVRGTFRMFGTDEETARNFIKRGDNLNNDDIGPYRLESRRAGTQGNDATWTIEPHRDDDRIPA